MIKISLKSIIIASMLAASFSASAQSNPITGAKILADDCAVLLDDVTIGLSSGVVGAWTCTPSANAIRVTTCHTAGRKSERTERVPCRPDGAEVNEDNQDLPACTGTEPTNSVTARGVSFMRGSTAGGAVGPLPLDGTTECTESSVGSRT